MSLAMNSQRQGLNSNTSGVNKNLPPKFTNTRSSILSTKSGVSNVKQASTSKAGTPLLVPKQTIKPALIRHQKSNSLTSISNDQVSRQSIHIKGNSISKDLDNQILEDKRTLAQISKQWDKLKYPPPPGCGYIGLPNPPKKDPNFVSKIPVHSRTYKSTSNENKLKSNSDTTLDAVTRAKILTQTPLSVKPLQANYPSKIPVFNKAMVANSISKTTANPSKPVSSTTKTATSQIKSTAAKSSVGSSSTRLSTVSKPQIQSKTTGITSAGQTASITSRNTIANNTTSRLLAQGKPIATTSSSVSKAKSNTTSLLKNSTTSSDLRKGSLRPTGTTISSTTKPISRVPTKPNTITQPKKTSDLKAKSSTILKPKSLPPSNIQLKSSSTTAVTKTGVSNINGVKSNPPKIAVKKPALDSKVKTFASTKNGLGSKISASTSSSASADKPNVAQKKTSTTGSNILKSSKPSLTSKSSSISINKNNVSKVELSQPSKAHPNVVKLMPSQSEGGLLSRSYGSVSSTIPYERASSSFSTSSTGYFSQAMSPFDVLKSFGKCLTPDEKTEILSYPNVYYFGVKAKKRNINAKHSVHDNAEGDYIYDLHDHLAYRYEIIKPLGKGSFGQVIKAYDYKNGKEVAIKIIRSTERFHRQALTEISILESITRWDKDDSHYVIHIRDQFSFRDHLCIVTDLYGMNLYEYIKFNRFKGFRQFIVQNFAYQVVQCLSLLYDHNVVHCDLKPENILLTDSSNTRIKVIDFGSSCFKSQRIYTYIQSRFYRSPEVILELPYGPPIDMWSLGCILVELSTGYPIFPGESESEQMAMILEVTGLPSPNLLVKSKRQYSFFDAAGRPRHNLCPKMNLVPKSRPLSSILVDADKTYIDFVSRCLEFDPAKRLTPPEALEHPFLNIRRSDTRSSRNSNSSQFANFDEEEAIRRAYYKTGNKRAPVTRNPAPAVLPGSQAPTRAPEEATLSAFTHLNINTQAQNEKSEFVEIYSSDFSELEEE